MTGLPTAWATITIGEASGFDGLSTDGDWIESKDQDPTGSVRLIQLQDIGDGTFVNKSSRFLTEEKAEELSCTFLSPGDVLIARMPDPLGRACRFPDIGQKSVTAVDVHVWRKGEHGVEPDFLVYCVNSPEIRQSLQAQASGTTRQRVSGGRLKAQEIPLPPLPEQRRIVRKLDTLSARSTTARTHLTAIEKLVERYKRLVIGQLCLGGVASQFQDQTELPELPQGWEWARAEDLCHWITKGTTPSKDELFAGKGEVPFIKVYNLTFSERLDFSVDPTFVSADTHNIALKRSRLFPGDVLINIVGPPLGKTAIVPDDFPEWNMNQAIAVFRPKERLFNRFLLYWLSSEWFLAWVLSRSKATAGQRNLTLEICRDTPVPLPSFDEQREIVRRIETAFAKIDRLKAEAAKALKLLGHLDQRILAKAFAGDLVPQDPNDEPAETLLARIIEARAAAPKGRRGRKPSA